MLRALVACIVEFLSIKYEITVLIFPGKGFSAPFMSLLVER